MTSLSSARRGSTARASLVAGTTLCFMGWGCAAPVPTLATPADPSRDFAMGPTEVWTRVAAFVETRKGTVIASDPEAGFISFSIPVEAKRIKEGREPIVYYNVFITPTTSPAGRTRVYAAVRGRRNHSMDGGEVQLFLALDPRPQGATP